MTGPTIKVIDIETLPHVVYTWGLFKQNIGLNQIIRDGALASACVKTIGVKGTRYADNRLAADAYTDTATLDFLYEELSAVDIVVWQNGVKFDHRKINARFIEMGYAPVAPFKNVDTMLHAKELAMFTSNRLEWLSKHLTTTPKSSHKQYPGFELWRGAIAGEEAAWEEMRKYNVRDVIATEALYLRLRPYMRTHPNVNVYNDSTKEACPACGSHKLQRRGFSYTDSGQYQRYQCTSCGSWSRSRFTTNSLAKRKSLLRGGA
jgi:predicted RNA-binding Zn-ribbon protein involved in translation (DUF1610 family)